MNRFVSHHHNQGGFQVGGEKGLSGSGAGTLGVPLEETRRVGGLLGVAGRLSGTVSPFRAEQGTSLEIGRAHV